MRSGILVSLILITAICSCQKKDSTAPDPASVSINITSPASGQVYHSGDTISIDADVTYTSELHGYEVKIADTASGFVVYDDAQHVHDDHFNIHDKWVNTGTQATGLKLTLTAIVDHDGGGTEKNIDFEYQP
ncbi:MAG: hypothetical protein BGO69_00800 [Bacteroidetes bacterium 46-16]|nr:MAG: hypothetical protein BGO69_00800 [Bacteroidetes bacterium 46-16]